jgi:hypothetical protein
MRRAIALALAYLVAIQGGLAVVVCVPAEATADCLSAAAGLDHGQGSTPADHDHCAACVPAGGGIAPPPRTASAPVWERTAGAATVALFGDTPSRPAAAGPASARAPPCA